jgi:hypothetical protein
MHSSGLANCFSGVPNYNNPWAGTRTFLALNDGTAGFSANND